MSLEEVIIDFETKGNVIKLYFGTEDDYFASFYGGNMTGKLIPKQRPWYNDAKNAGKTVFTEPYVDKNTGKLVVSVVSPFNGTSDRYCWQYSWYCRQRRDYV